MNTEKNWSLISSYIADATGIPFKPIAILPISGGDINSAYHLQGRTESYFIKLNTGHLLPMFEAEFAGLEEMAKTNTVTVPKPIICGRLDNEAFLIQRHILFGDASRASDQRLGERLAALHRIPQPYYGWHRDNTIGCTPQTNRQNNDWVSFWRDNRLVFQLNLAAGRGYGGQLQVLGESLCSQLESFFSSYIQPSLLHGDLWSGNAAVDRQGQPVIFDPACYYGDREADIAMTELFGGFSQDFYASYNQAWPLDEGYRVRKNLYNLYHILNHLNLFGGSYLKQAENIMAQLMAEIR